VLKFEVLSVAAPPDSCRCPGPGYWRGDAGVFVPAKPCAPPGHRRSPDWQLAVFVPLCAVTVTCSVSSRGDVQWALLAVAVLRLLCLIRPYAGVVPKRRCRRNSGIGDVWKVVVLLPRESVVPVASKNQKGDMPVSRTPPLERQRTLVPVHDRAVGALTGGLAARPPSRRDCVALPPSPCTSAVGLIGGKAAVDAVPLIAGTDQAPEQCKIALVEDQLNVELPRRNARRTCTQRNAGAAADTVTVADCVADPRRRAGQHVLVVRSAPPCSSSAHCSDPLHA